MPTFAVLAHTDSAMLNRLLSLLRPHPIVVHLDAALDADQYFAQVDLSGVTLVPASDRVRVTWASWSVVEAMLALGRHALALTAAGEHVVYLSAQDYPIRPVAQFDQLLDAHSQTEYIKLFDARSRAVEFDLHFHQRHFQDVTLVRNAVRWSRTDRPNLALRRGLRVLARARGPVSEPPGVTLAISSQWFAVTPGCMRYLIDSAQGEIARYFRRVWAPDERYFASMIASSAQYREASLTPQLAPWPGDVGAVNYHYVDRLVGRALHTEDFAAIESSPAFFARKFGSVASAEVLAMIDELREDRAGCEPASEVDHS